MADDPDEADASQIAVSGPQWHQSGMPATRSHAQPIDTSRHRNPVLAYADVNKSAAWLCEVLGFSVRLRINKLLCAVERGR